MLLADRYELGDLIGRGGMADVHAGLDTRLKREVAIKIMRSGTEGGPGPDDLEARFEDEARVAARLQHPNVVSVFDTGITEEGCPFIVMERLPGETLADRLRAGPMAEPAVLALAEDVLGALGAAHNAGVVHRDIKPGNILLTEDGRAKIADFGIARESDALHVEATSVNALTGTPAYLAPERIDGKAATAQSDLWAVGVVLYEALGGRKPFEGPTPLAVAVAVRDGDPTPLRELRPDVDPTTAAVVDRAMAPDPTARFAGAADMAAALSADPDATIVEAGQQPDQTVMLAAPAVGTPGAVAASGAAAAAALGGSVTGRAAWWRGISGRSKVWAGGAAAATLLLVAVGLAVGRGNGGGADVPAKPVVAVSTTSAPATTITTSPPVQNVVVTPVPAVRRKAKGKRGGKD